MTEEIDSSTVMPSVTKKIAWFVALYVGGVAAVAAVALVVRFIVLSATR